MQLSEEQQDALNCALSGGNIFLYAKAGTGKSCYINELTKRLPDGSYVLLGTTGVAASNIGGSTFHSFFSIKPFGVAVHEEPNWANMEKRQLWDKTYTIIIDEVSMLRADVLDAANKTLIKNGCQPLSSKQLIFVGDMKQLQSILKGKEEKILYAKYYSDTDFRASDVYKSLEVKELTFTKVFRQDDIEFKQQLDRVRDSGSNYLTPYFRQFIKPIKNDGIIISGYNDVVDRYNIEGLQELDTQEITYRGAIFGRFKESDYLVTEYLTLKHGCKVMYLHNHPHYPMVNGSLGTFLLVEGQSYIRFKDRDYPLEKVEFQTKEYRLVDKKILDSEGKEKIIKVPKLVSVSSIEQYPLRVAYALTAHKCQGLTIEKITVDLRKALFAKNQLYVILSRVTSPQGLTILV